jgi:hypothetical protein
LFGSSEVAIPVTADLQNAQTVAIAWGAIGRMLTPAFMGVTALIAFISLLAGTNMVTALYVDLRARRGDFDPDEDSAEVQEFEGYGR